MRNGGRWIVEIQQAALAPLPFAVDIQPSTLAPCDRRIRPAASSQLASRCLFDVHVRATGDVHIDDHHTNEDVALAIGTDLSGRPYLGYNLEIPTPRVGSYDTQYVAYSEFQLWHAFGGTFLSVIGEHIRNDSPYPPACWKELPSYHRKAFARALRQATEPDLRRQGTIPRVETTDLNRSFAAHPLMPAFEVLPFGSGRRGCPGMTLAMMERPMVFAPMIQCFEWKVVDDKGKKLKVEITERPGLTAPGAHDLVCVPIARSRVNEFNIFKC